MSPSDLAVPQTVHTLYTHHYSWLRTWLVRKLDNAFDAADLAQDVFVRLLARRDRAAVMAMREPRAYLRTIAHGLVVDHWRRRDLEQAWLEALAAQPEAWAPSPELRLELLEALIQIDRMLDTLKPLARKAFLLAQLEGLSCPKIAARLGVSLATAERYVAQGLRACLALQAEA
ncbi:MULTISPECIES: sigma-70 family RNA polymerase sigma factor [Achromobacter]|uniref:sigma-70 family RNA polymerase sigma factor n=1 Tax=Achromobacter TaxID=222 RepID=UPI0006C580BA|nr:MULTISPECIES: sigma-70 family RNA polymerase sigma factor [Achromobacter]CUJ35518.1 Probable RNA polymerase sigma factor fecI [Achromobacter sp. 2789STDY5608621]